MTVQQHLHYNKIAEAIAYIKTHFKEQPNLDEVAEKVHLSPFHFQRLFSEWAGTSPKKFLQYTTIEYAKSLLKENQPTLFETAYESGLSGTSRLHDLFVQIEGMTPAEYKNGGKNLSIKYSFSPCLFGNILVATTEKGVCHMAFEEDELVAFAHLQNQFPNAIFTKMETTTHQNVLSIFTNDWSKLNDIKLHLKGSDFQLKVWQALLEIPIGRLTTYGAIATKIDKATAARAVGTAIGSNPVAFLIPCHRVIQSTGVLGGYMWGKTRKTAIIGWEGVKTQSSIV